MDPSAWTERYYNQGQSDFSFAGAANGPTGNRAFQYLHSSSPYPTGNNGFNGYFYNNPELDALLEAGAAEFDPAKQDAIYQEACALMNERAAVDLPVADGSLPHREQQAPERHPHPGRRWRLVLRRRRDLDQDRVVTDRLGS